MPSPPKWLKSLVALLLGVGCLMGGVWAFLMGLHPAAAPNLPFGLLVAGTVLTLLSIEPLYKARKRCLAKAGPPAHKPLRPAAVTAPHTLPAMEVVQALRSDEKRGEGERTHIPEDRANFLPYRLCSDTNLKVPRR
jgi:hypothetical protein